MSVVLGIDVHTAIGLTHGKNVAALKPRCALRTNPPRRETPQSRRRKMLIKNGLVVGAPTEADQTLDRALLLVLAEPGGRDRVAAALERAALETGDSSLRQAARITRDRPTGRPKIDDDDLVDDVRAKMSAGQSRSGAIREVAAINALGVAPASLERRLRRRCPVSWTQGFLSKKFPSTVQS